MTTQELIARIEALENEVSSIQESVEGISATPCQCDDGPLTFKEVCIGEEQLFKFTGDLEVKVNKICNLLNITELPTFLGIIWPKTEIEDHDSTIACMYQDLEEADDRIKWLISDSKRKDTLIRKQSKQIKKLEDDMLELKQLLKGTR